MRKLGFGLMGLVLTICMCWHFGVVESEAEPKVKAERDTLENQTVLTGSAEAGTWIFCSVYTYNQEEKTTLLYQASSKVGESGLYQLTIPLPVLGRQYVMVRIGSEENTYAYNRYSKQLANELQGYYLNIYQVMQGES